MGAVYAPQDIEALLLIGMAILALVTVIASVLGLCRAAARPRPRPPSCDEWARRGDLRGGR